MPGVNIGWDNATPAGSESVSLGDDRIRSAKSSIQQWGDAEHVFPSSGGAGSGVHRPGSAVAFYGAQSLVSSSDTEGRLMFTSNTSRLFGTPSNGTVLIGGPTVPLMGSFPGTAPQRHYWAVEMGEIVGPASGSTTLNYPNSGFSGCPFVQCSAFSELQPDGPQVQLFVIVTGNSKTQCIFKSKMIQAGVLTAASGHTIFWQSIGTRVL